MLHTARKPEARPFSLYGRRERPKAPSSARLRHHPNCAWGISSHNSKIVSKRRLHRLRCFHSLGQIRIQTADLHSPRRLRHQSANFCQRLETARPRRTYLQLPEHHISNMSDKLTRYVFANLVCFCKFKTCFLLIQDTDSLLSSVSPSSVQTRCEYEVLPHQYPA